MRTSSTSQPIADAADRGRSWRFRLRWWQEIAFVLTFYFVYSAVRNKFGSAAVEPATALRNAEHMIRVEEAMGLFREHHLQQLFLDWDWFMWTWNVFYGTFHFWVTIFALVWLYIRFPDQYPRMRTTLAATTGLALIGFSLFPLMPPRLLEDCGRYGGCTTIDYGFVNTLRDYGGLWSFDSGTMQKLSNQYAAMPSLHFGWSTWCLLVFWPTVRTRWARGLIAAYPICTLFAIMVTANHYWIDAVGGLIVLGAGLAIGTRLGALEVRFRRGTRSEVAGS